jgi:hypothetical protein
MVVSHVIEKVHELTDSSVTAAGIIRDSPFLEHSERDFRDTMDVNVSEFGSLSWMNSDSENRR